MLVHFNKATEELVLKNKISSQYYKVCQKLLCKYNLVLVYYHLIVLS